MFVRLHKDTKEKIKFFDSILYYLSDNFSQPITLHDIKLNIEGYTDKRLEGVTGLGKFFEEDNIEKIYEKALNLLVESNYVKKESSNYYLTIDGLSLVSSRGLVGKEKRDISKYNFQNWIWFIIILTFLTNLAFKFIFK